MRQCGRVAWTSVGKNRCPVDFLPIFQEDWDDRAVRRYVRVEIDIELVRVDEPPTWTRLWNGCDVDVWLVLLLQSLDLQCFGW